MATPERFITTADKLPKQSTLSLIDQAVNLLGRSKIFARELCQWYLHEVKPEQPLLADPLGEPPVILEGKNYKFGINFLRTSNNLFLAIKRDLKNSPHPSGKWSEEVWLQYSRLGGARVSYFRMETETNDQGAISYEKKQAVLNDPIAFAKAEEIVLSLENLSKF